MSERDWEVSGSDCCSPFNTCLLSWCCPCITYGRTHHRLQNHNLDGYSCCNGSCVGFAALTYCGFSWIMAMLQRGDIRSSYQLKGNGCKDCLCACCCMPCDLTQQDKEVEFREAEKARLISQQPNKQGGMQYQQQ
ncbi:hypothetical protein K432DRAFT_336263 [Lepidopterella palustris CBS 459.81]|uniref:PLAC8-domain-containing protein n=1 Tax=Lepidopterella palustris CBS 459.81 TaxID=1314670 RepID=A0A8E2E2N2_9PEZI|nr:hypothetical protein K432DRAFT_336263 [Lepidopterella palustris CBS 459.81]